jgi:hypothetical protein
MVIGDRLLALPAWPVRALEFACIGGQNMLYRLYGTGTIGALRRMGGGAEG